MNNPFQWVASGFVGAAVAQAVGGSTDMGLVFAVCAVAVIQFKAWHK